MNPSAANPQAELRQDRWDTEEKMLCSIEDETLVLGGMLLDEAIIPHVMQLQPDDFWVEKHREIFKAIRNLWLLGSKIDLVTVAEKLNNADLTIYLADLPGMTASPHLAESAARLVHRYGQLRQLRHNLIRIEQSLGRQTKVEDTLESLNRIIARVGIGETEIRGTPEVLREVIQEIEERQKGTKPKGIMTGIEPLDDMLLGLPECLTIIGGRTATGKTALALQIASFIARKDPVLFCSCEMPAQQLVLRALSYQSEVPIYKILRPMAEDDYGKFKEGMGKVGQSKIYWLWATGYAPSTLYAKIMGAYHKIKPVLIIVDYLQLVARANKKQSPYEAASEASMFFKRLSQQLKVPVIVLSQVARIKGTKREAGITKESILRLVMDDLRDSGNIEQDADLVLFIQSPGLISKKTDIVTVEIQVAKNRLWGGTDRWKYDFHRTMGRFKRHTEEPKDEQSDYNDYRHD